MLAGDKMADIRWLLDVIVDLRDYARRNQLYDIDQKLVDVAEVALKEIASADVSDVQIARLNELADELLINIDNIVILEPRKKPRLA